MKISLYLFFFFILGLTFNSQTGNFIKLDKNVINETSSDPIVLKIEAESSVLNFEYVEIIEDQRLSGQRGVTLINNVTAAIDGERPEADLVFNLTLPEGRYVLNTYAVTDSVGVLLMKNASKFESLFMRMQIDNDYPKKKVIYVPWDVPNQESGIFDFFGENQQLKIWLPQGVRLDYIRIHTYIPPSVPETVNSYNPSYVPPSSRPRLWVNEGSLGIVKERLNKGENKIYWENVKKNALEPYERQYKEDEKIVHDDKLENAAQNKAFYYLMTEDKEVGRNAVELMTNYLPRLEFNNLLDISREIGRAIYTASLVYDWCYNIMQKGEMHILRENMIRLAEEMEIGWPPFRQPVVIGHGGEAQLNRDLLSMSIAIYDENPLPYKYCSYRVLEELVPMRSWEYQSPRHNQGIDYGAYRSIYDMHAAWLFYRMTGEKVFNENIENLPLYWLYMRLPNGQMLRDGDGTSWPRFDRFDEKYYWGNPNALFLFYTYTSNSMLKGEFIRQGGTIENPILFLLLNDPELKANENLNTLPLTIDFGPILGSMVARTGWNIGPDSDDVVAEIKGGGYHFGNHQHSDAGALQIYYRGMQVADLGLYGYYGTPYDVNFNKRSISHSMMLAVDPKEKFGNTESNDGGTKYNQRNPLSPKIAQSDPWFNNGAVLSTDFGPSKKTPVYSYFSVNLKGAYTSKIEDYVRQFCFINLYNDSIPAIVILADNMITSDPSFKKYWQINTHNSPSITDSKIILENSFEDKIGKIHVQLLVPDKKDYSINVLSGEETNSSFEHKYEIPSRLAERKLPEANGHRIMLSPVSSNRQDHFISVFQVAAGNNSPFEVDCLETVDNYVIKVKDYIVCMNKNIDLMEESFTLKIPQTNSSSKVIIAGIKAGVWNIKRKDGKINFDVKVSSGKNSIYYEASDGDYIITPH